MAVVIVVKYVVRGAVDEDASDDDGVECVVEDKGGDVVVSDGAAVVEESEGLDDGWVRVETGKDVVVGISVEA